MLPRIGRRSSGRTAESACAAWSVPGVGSLSRPGRHPAPDGLKARLTTRLWCFTVSDGEPLRHRQTRCPPYGDFVGVQAARWIMGRAAISQQTTKAGRPPECRQPSTAADGRDRQFRALHDCRHSGTEALRRRPACWRSHDLMATGTSYRRQLPSVWPFETEIRRDVWSMQQVVFCRKRGLGGRAQGGRAGALCRLGGGGNSGRCQPPNDPIHAAVLRHVAEPPISGAVNWNANTAAPPIR